MTKERFATQYIFLSLLEKFLFIVCAFHISIFAGWLTAAFLILSVIYKKIIVEDTYNYEKSKKLKG